MVPLLKNAKEPLVETAEYKEAQFRLTYLAQTRGFGILTGGPGKGKTTVVRNWGRGLNSSLYKVIYSSLSILTVNEFYRSLAEELGAVPAYQKTENFHAIQNEITRLSLEKKQTPVIVMDEANYVGTGV